MIKSKREYKDGIKSLKKKVFSSCESEILGISPYLTIQTETNKFFANLNRCHFLGGSFSKEDQGFFRKMIFHQLLSVLEMDCTHDLVKKQINLDFKDNNLAEPAIYCSFHYGSYLFLFHALKMLNKKFSFIIISPERGKEIVASQKKQCSTSSARKAQEEFNPEIIGAENVNNSLEVLKRIRKKENIVIFIDTFVKKSSPSNKRTKQFQFLDSVLHLHSGISDISKKLKVPIIPVVSERTESGITNIKFYEAVCKKNFSSETYSEDAIQECFDLFSLHLKRHPEQWDQWQYIHNNILRLNSHFVYDSSSDEGEKVTDNKMVKFNIHLFQLIEENNQKFLIKLDDYKCFKISPQLAEALEKIIQLQSVPVTTAKTLLNPKLADNLLHNQVLTFSNKKLEQTDNNCLTS